jgi:hypothetical protein
MAETYGVPADVSGTLEGVDYAIKAGTYTADAVDPETLVVLQYLALNTTLVDDGSAPPVDEPAPVDPPADETPDEPAPDPKPKRTRAAKTEE